MENCTQVERTLDYNEVCRYIVNSNFLLETFITLKRFVLNPYEVGLNSSLLSFCFVFPLFKGVASIGNFIYAIGGYDGQNQLNSVERYDIENDIWEDLPPMNSRRSALSVDVIGEKLFALGRFTHAA